MLDIIRDDKEIFEVSNGTIGFNFFKLGENQGNFRFRFKDIDGSEFSLENCFACINYHQSDTVFLKSCTSLEYCFENQIEEIKDKFGKGLKIVFGTVCATNQFIEFKVQVKIYDENDFLLIKIIDIIDNSQDSLPVHSISPLTTKNSSLWLSSSNRPTDLRKISWFKNGWQSWSPCKVLFGTQKDRKGPPTRMFKRVLENQDYEIKGRFYSEYCTVITDLESNNSIILGFVTLKDQFSRILLDYDKPDEMKILTAFGCMDGVKFQSSSINTSEELFITFKSKKRGYYGLIEYAKVIKSYIKENRINEVPVGWCSWYYYFTKITEEEMVKNLDFFKNNIRNLPIDFIQLDDGYQKAIGDYNIINEKFPNKLHWLFTKVHNAGFKSGIWTGPFFAHKKSELFKKHPDWFLKKKGSSKLIKATFNWGAFLYGLDLTKPEVLEYIKNLFHDLSHGFDEEAAKDEDLVIDFFKIDFIHASVPYDGDYTDKTLTRAQLYYNGVKAVRDGITDKAFLLGCGAPLGPCVGLVDAMRIGTDTAPSWKMVDKLANKFNFAVPSLKRGLLPAIYRSFMHKYLWINDPDCLMLRRTNTKLSYDEIKLQVTVFGLSGGQLLISDDMSLLSEDEINDAKLVIPPFNPDYSDPIPIDILFSKYPSIYMLETDEDIGRRYLVAFFNWEDKTKSQTSSIIEMIPSIPDNENSFYIYDFWNQQFIGEFRKDEVIQVKDLPPHSCRYFSIIPIDTDSQDEPIFISSNLHLTQGCCEITDFSYDENEKKVIIIIDLPGQRKGKLLLKLPENLSIIKSTCPFSQFDKKYNLWQLSVEFEDNFEFEVYFQ
jgi:alpha-galactosidase